MTVRNPDGSLACICHEHRPACDCASDLTDSQRAFLRLHVTRLVDRWQWHFRGAMIRAHAGALRATISSAELTALVSRGLVRRGGGAAVYPTKTAKELFA